MYVTEQALQYSCSNAPGKPPLTATQECVQPQNTIDVKDPTPTT